MDWIKHITRLVAALLLQILLIGNLQLMGVCEPFIYIVFLLMMPTRFPAWADMLIGAALGLVMDIFCNSLGIHMGAAVLICYLRQPIIQNLVMDYDRLKGEISSATIGMENYIKYATVLTVIYHTVVFAVSAWSMAHIGLTLLTIVVSSIISLILILGYEFVRR